MTVTEETPSPSAGTVFKAPGVPPAGGVLDLSKSALDVGLDGSRDPDLMDDEPAGSPLLQALEQLSKPVELPEIEIEVRTRPGFKVRFSTEIDADKDLKRWSKASTPKGRNAETDGIAFACVGMANLCLAISYNGVELESEDGRALTFSSPELLRQYGASRVREVVRRFYGADPYLAATFDAVLEKAGIGEQVDVVDPTEGSSI